MVGGGARETSVKIVVRTGSGKNPLRGLERLHNKDAVMDVGLSWAQAFSQHFKVDLDPSKYLVRGGPSSTKHILTEPIRIWMDEYKKVLKQYVVNVVENSAHNRAAPVTATAPAPAPPPAVPPVASGAGRKQLLSPQKNRPDKRQKGKVKFPNPKRVKREPSPTLSADSRMTTAVPPRTAQGAAGGTSPTASTSRSFVAGRNGVQQQNGSGTSRNRVGDERSQLLPTPPPPQSQRRRFQEDEMPNDMDNLRNGIPNGMQDDDNFDAESQCSQDSQDSQDDLVELGIPHEDFKSVFVKNAMDKLSNSQLLKCRYHMQQLKKSDRKWSKWKLMNSYTVAVLELLFGDL